MTRSYARMGWIAALVFGVVTPTFGLAQNLVLDFAPPDVDVTPVCAARMSDVDLMAEWGAWDGKSLPDRDVGVINRDMRRLAEIDPMAWDPTIQRVITLLPGVSPGFTANHATLARIEQMIALGSLQELRSGGLVQQLLDRGEENSPRMLFVLSGFLSEGIGIERDTARGNDLLMAAGYAGNADALLALSHLAVQGRAPKGWDLDPKLAVTIAFGALVGQMDPLICDRIARIAREYANGEVVQRDHDLAVRWYRFAADLGDPIAAWRVAEYEIQSELVTKDNDVLLTYLALAAEGGLPYAQVALGRIYENGALVPRDLQRAQALYEASAAGGDRAGLIRLSGFLETQMQADPAQAQAFHATLDRLAALPDAPPWVFAKRAAHILDIDGRWAGQPAARVLLERGARIDDPAAILMLAQMDFGAAKDTPAFYAAVDRLIHAVVTLGEVAPTEDLQAAFICKAPEAPLLDEAKYWAGVEAAIGSSSLQLTDAALAELAENPDPLAMAALQTQALYGRATPLANLLAVMERDGSPASEVAFWTAYADRFANVGTARAALALDAATTPDARSAALDSFRAAVAAGESGAPLKLAKALIQDGTDAAKAEATDLLRPLAEKGGGEAMALLAMADPATFPTKADIFRTYAAQIEARGDFWAILLAMPFLPDQASRDAYQARAITAMQCAFPEAIALATLAGGQGDVTETRRWLGIATHLAGQDTWQLVQLGDSYRSLLGPEGEPVARALYVQAYGLGSRTAVLRLLRIHGDPAAADYDQAQVVGLYLDLVARSDPGQITAVLDELSRKKTGLRQAIEARLDLDRLYADAAKAGNPAAMREHSRRLRAVAVSADDLAAATRWLVMASESGDVPAMVMLAQAYSVGVGVSPSIENARAWLERAAASGDPTAIDMVKFFTLDTGSE